MRFHLIDRIEEVCYGKYITAVKCVSLADDYFAEHFPGYPILPGSLLIESLAQLGGSFFELMMKHEGIPVRSAVLSIVNHVKLRRPVFPGDRLLLRAEVTCRREEFGAVHVTANVDGQLCADGELTFSFMDVHDERLRQSRQELYDICMRNTRMVEGQS